VQVARALGIHPNTLRHYEAQGYLPPIPRSANGYRRYSAAHLEQARLAVMTLQWPYVGDRALLVELVMCAAQSNFTAAESAAVQYLARLQQERAHAEAAVSFLERWAVGGVADPATGDMHTQQAADYLGVTVDMLRNWERSGLIVVVPRDPATGYRRYGTTELGRLRVIRLLVKAGYSQMAVLRALSQLDRGRADDLRAALELPHEDSANEAIEIIADRWLSSLERLAQHTEEIIIQIRRMAGRETP
jgi:DNA-binding transcriptional MerR regulator